MNKFEQQMKERIKEANFNFCELAGFKVKPELALLAGMALGYKMALELFYASRNKGTITGVDPES